MPLTRESDGIWSGKVTLEEGGLVRYVYDRWDEQDWGQFKTTREASNESIQIESRFLLVTRDLTEVQDTVETWNDLRVAAPTGTIAGIVVDAVTGTPLMDTNVSVGGIHTASDYDGRFRVADVAAGPQRVTVHRNVGDYQPAAAVAQVVEGQTAEAQIAMQPAQPVRVTFDVILPDDMPADAEVRLVGSVFQAGARPGVTPNMPIMGTDLLLPQLDKIAPDRARGILELHHGTYLQYYYSIGSSSRGREFDENGAHLFRSFVVDASGQTRTEQVITWRPSPPSVQLTLRVTVPPNTTPGVPVAFNAGPSHWMTQTGPYQWTFYLHGYPGQEDRYRYTLGDDSLGIDGTTGLEEEGFRRLTYPPEDAVIDQRLDKWRWSDAVLAAAADEPIDVTFRVTVPSSTPREATVRLAGDAPALRSGVAMRQQPGNPWLYTAAVSLPGAQTVEYWYDRGALGTESFSKSSLSVAHTGLIVNDWVSAWADAPPSPEGTRPGFVTGIYVPDFWSDGFLALSPSTFRRIDAHNGGWVVLSSVWHYG